MQAPQRRSIRSRCRSRILEAKPLHRTAAPAAVGNSGLNHRLVSGFYAAENCPDRLRRIRFRDPGTGNTLVFPTNNTTLPALTIVALYKSRWQVELFFKWIKQHLRIKRFLATFTPKGSSS